MVLSLKIKVICDKPNLEIADNVFVFDTKAFKADQITDERDL